MTSRCNWRNMHPPTAILFFKIILRTSLADGKLKIPNSFTRKYGGGLSNPVFLKPPDGIEWKVYWTKHDGEIWFQKGGKEFATYYSLDHGHLVLFEYEETFHFVIHIFDMSGLEIDYPFHGTQDEKGNLDQSSDDSVKILYELLPCQKTRLKSTMSSPQPRKKLRTGTTGDVERSSNLQIQSQHVQTKGNQSQGTIFEKSPFASVRKELDEDMGGTTECPKVEQLTSTKIAEALNKATTFRSKKPSFMLVMKPYDVDGYSLNVPSQFAENYLKKKQGVILLQVLDGRTWPVIYSLHKINAGWKKFASDNNLNVGDVCVFELTRRRGLSLKVLISRVAKEPSCPLSQGVQFFSELDLVQILESVQGDGVKWLDSGRILVVENKTDITNKGGKATERTSLLISPPPGTNGALKEAKKFTSENPFFIVNIRPIYLGENRPRVPTVFIRRYFNNKKQIVMLQFEKKLWPVKLLCFPYKTSGKLSSGWSLFAGESKLQAGDVCIFELINREDAVLDVHIFRGH